LAGFGRAYGAVTVINAFATGFGAALGIDLKVETHVEKGRSLEIEVDIRGNRADVDKRLVHEILRYFRVKYGLSDELYIEIYSEIPLERGLKSSSAVANSLTLALSDYLGLSLDNETILDINVSTSLEAGVSLTGALDDAAASLPGGLVVTDNLGRRIIKHSYVDRKDVLIAYPSNRVKTIYFKDLDFKPIESLVESALETLHRGDWLGAMTLNGLIYAGFLGYPVDPIYVALREGAEASALTGKGPAYAAVGVALDSVREAWAQLGRYRFILTRSR
jgi:shikimate kinase